jgi:hypothetical protein
VPPPRLSTAAAIASPETGAESDWRPRSSRCARAMVACSPRITGEGETVFGLGAAGGLTVGASLGALAVLAGATSLLRAVASFPPARRIAARVFDGTDALWSWSPEETSTVPPATGNSSTYCETPEKGPGSVGGGGSCPSAAGAAADPMRTSETATRTTPKAGRRDARGSALAVNTSALR